MQHLVVQIVSLTHNAGSLSDEQVVKKIEQFATASATGFITSMDVAQTLQVSIVLAKEFLLLAEQKELLCRDETIEAIRFYPNFFKRY